MRHEHDAGGRGAEFLRGVGVGGEAGWKWPEDASDNEPNLRLARELHVRRALVTATGNAAEGISRGNIRGREGGRDPACWEAPGPDAALHRARHMAPQASSTRDQHVGMDKGCGATIFGGS